MRRLLLIVFLFLSFTAFTQDDAARHWADSVYKTLSAEQRIAQLMIVRLSTIDLKTRQITYYDKKVADLVKQYNVGGICVFQGAQTMQANTINALQALNNLQKCVGPQCHTTAWNASVCGVTREGSTVGTTTTKSPTCLV